MFTSVYPLEVQVVPGSTVLVNSEDVTDVVDHQRRFVGQRQRLSDRRQRHLHPRAPNHVETRRDVTIYRAQLEIEVELDTSVRNETDSADAHFRQLRGRARTSVDTPNNGGEPLHQHGRPATLGSSLTLVHRQKIPCASAP